MKDIIEIAKKYLSYDQSTGVFRWLESKGAAKRGNEAGCVFSNGDGNNYRTICISGKNVLAHRLAWALYHGSEPSGQIDHIDGNGLNNSISNLRVVTNQGNARNQKLKKNNTSGVCGVIWFKPASLWRAQIKVSGKYRYLGYFKVFDDAVTARKAAERELNFHSGHGKPRSF